jgi:hypothetical protein
MPESGNKFVKSGPAGGQNRGPRRDAAYQCKFVLVRRQSFGAFCVGNNDTGAGMLDDIGHFRAGAPSIYGHDHSAK